MDKQDINTLITRSEAICAHINTAVTKEAYAAAVPDGWRIESLETLRPQRQYPRGKYRTTHWGDFIAYGKARQGEGAACFIDPNKMSARILFDYHDGAGHAKNTATYDIEGTPLFLAIQNKTGNPLKQRDLTDLLEDWGENITACDKEGEVMTTAQAVAILSSLTVGKAKSIKQTQEDFAHERTISEQAALKADGRMVSELRITDPLYQGTEKPITARFRIALVVDGDAFYLRLRYIGGDADRRAKAEEMMESAKAALAMPVYAGEYDAR